MGDIRGRFLYSVLSESQRLRPQCLAEPLPAAPALRAPRPQVLLTMSSSENQETIFGAR